MILDTLAMLIEVKGGKLAIKEIENVEEALNETEKTAKKQDKSLANVSKGFHSLRANVMRAIAPLAAFGVVVNRTVNFASQGENLLFMANSAGIAADKFSALALAAEKLGGSRQGMGALMGSISANLMGIRRGEENALTNAAMYYGLSLSGRRGLANPEEMLYNIAGAMQGKSAMEQADLGRMLGLDAGTLRLVQQGVSGVRRELELANRYNPFKDKETMRNIQNFQYSLREMKMGIGMIAGEMFKELLPHFSRWSEISKDTIDYLLEHTDAVKLAFVALGGAVLAMLGPMGLLVGLFGLLVDDYLTFERGGDSLLSPLWQGVDTLLEKLAKLQVWFESHSEDWWMKILTGAAETTFSPITALKNNGKKAMDALKGFDFGQLGNILAAAGPAGAVFNTNAYFTINESGDVQNTVNGVSEGLKNTGIVDANDQLAEGVQ